ncbi:NDP-sugar epimerase, includes UDP-GlcNAc-inverting 4,6-dehydratase FlaA1 and capsular polysaccharide biosynthesis protein EpsC [Lutimaribacter pacificus]|uniref:NDP-sugar epimerase, includes UDP-GlcNAc-inverting 4,6-dehydratase FlaA1 and capsular polysaccharide biosynthesis protein EpsC n=1 Tax=Lutimaribacter pacificus TaxID=391948 RepID=A0A1H0G4E1_9RHOB|nr:nucleoside-diphosphate sugar epimerase/dehydratase [Lutimaribacter pacificus]SDO01711.1 NDP-sugar epimerase, includes UDP-GlcNAc-inverting 4,6-dehydratase FlaA1 and capsular polysaccharide biosynthesis protein EpsC [Lutimaribacter pacificus]SHJ84818.1 NDP-sugar epimerase, includes UDP-GlcNAc-inverting 4,6-dehydratase FlaA1 and capsular polysaccharide biosynthesis protein EpsC [Lutimaribacter pacificus]
MFLYRMVTSLSRFQKRLIFLTLDIAMVPLAVLLAVALTGTPPEGARIVWLTLAISAIAALAAILTGLPRIKLNAYESRGIVRTALFAALTGLGGLAVNHLMLHPLFPRAFVTVTMAYLILSVSWRVLLRQALIAIYRRGQDRMRVIVYGAGRTGQQLAAALRTDDAVTPVAFVDDNPALQGLVVAGLPVFAPLELAALTARHRIDRIVLAMPSVDARAQMRIARRLRPLGVELHSLPSFATLVSGSGVSLQQAAQPVEELLGRAHLDADLPGAAHSYTGRTILITGAGGTIGGELCRQLLACAPARLILLDHSELALYTIDTEMRADPQGADIVPVLGSVTDMGLVAHILKIHRVEVIVHAAAYKHVPLVEGNEIAGLWNNVFGTRVIAAAALRAGVRRFILVSSDKAVRPANVMGASKRLAEMVVQDLATRATRTKFAMVRFGNVLGSSGSVIPLFREQIARGGPVTLTHEQVSRYFMTRSEAARLVLLAGSYARGGDLFVLDMGQPVPIRTLARQMIEGAGLAVRDADTPDGDIEIRITGLRPGEKLREELLISADMLTTPHPGILRAQESALSEIEMANALRDLRDAIDAHDAKAAREVLARWVEQPESDLQLAARA